MERREQDHRKKEFQKEDIIKQLKKDSVFNSLLSSDDRVENKRRLLDQKAQQEELATFQDLIDSENERKRVAETKKRDEEIIQRLDEIKLDRFREEKIRQSIRENSTELRELEKKLNYAYMNKERSLQIQEKQLLIKQQKMKELERASEFQKENAINIQKDLEKEKNAHQRAINYKNALTEQLKDHEKQKAVEFEQFLREKAMVDEIVRKIIQEDEQAAINLHKKQNETKKYVEEFIKDRMIWKQDEINRQTVENNRIAAYAQMMRDRQEEISSKKNAEKGQKDSIYQKLAHDMSNQEKEKEELETLRIELHQEELEAAARKRDQELLLQRIKRRLELIDAYQNQLADKRRLQEKMKEEEDVFREKLMAKFAEDDRIEQMSQQKKRMKNLEHRRAIEALIEERRIISNQKAVDHEAQHNEEMERYRQAVIEQERQRLLQEHASKLVGFLPKGVLRDKKDLELFDEEFRKKFGS